MRALWKSLVAGILTIMTLTIAPVLAFAHTALEESNPVDGAVVSVMPSSIALIFSEDLMNLGEEGINRLSLTNPESQEVTLDAVVVDGPKLLANVNLGTEDFVPGRYVISYRVVSADGHPVKGEISFQLTSQAVNSESASPRSSAEEEPSAKGVNFIIIFTLIISILVIGALLIVRKKK